MNYFLSLAISYNLMCCWFFTNFTAHIASLLLKEHFYCREDVSNFLQSRGWNKWADWYSCPLCSGSWIVAFVCLCTAIVTHDYWIMLYGTFSIPAICYSLMRMQKMF